MKKIELVCGETKIWEYLTPINVFSHSENDDKLFTEEP